VFNHRTHAVQVINPEVEVSPVHVSVTFTPAQR
jgi:hypothetical protein